MVLERKIAIVDLNKSSVEISPTALTILGENAYHCDLCLGNPQCIRVCTPGALTLSK
jgi:ferredoxin